MFGGFGAGSQGGFGIDLSGLDISNSEFAKPEEKEKKWGLNFIERKSGAKYGTEEYWAYVDEHPELEKAAKARGGKFAPPEPYRISDETKQIAEGTKAAAETIRGQAEEAVDVAGSQRGMVEGLGAGQERAARGESTASAVSSVAQVGGASASALGAISQIQQGNISSMRDAGIQTQMFRDQAEKDYRQALMDKGGAEVAAISTEIQGLQEMGRAKEQQYQVNILDPFYSRQQADIQEHMANITKPLTVWEKLGF